MIINSIEMAYFYRFYKPEKLEFSTDEKKNVTVIKGNNGTGKTTMLSAFSWVFYGKVEQPLVIEAMLNKKRLYEMKDGEVETSYVQVSITNDKNTYIIRRSQKFRRVDAHAADLYGEPELLVSDMNNPGKPIKDDKFFERFIPEHLSGFFFFDGERIDRLAQIDGRDEIRKAILDILGLTTLEVLDSVFSGVAQEFNRDAKKNAKDKEVQELSDQYEICANEISRLKDDIASCSKEKIGLQKVLSKCNSFLAEHNAEQVKMLHKEREHLESSSLDYKNRIENERAAIARHISKNFKYVLIAKYIPRIKELLEEKRKKRELPSDIKAQFIEDLLNDKLCICGRPLVEHTEWYDKLVSLKTTAGREELDNAYVTMSAFVNSPATASSIGEFFALIYESKERISNFNALIEKNDKRLAEIGKELSGDFDGLIAANELLRDNTQNQLKTVENKILICNHDLERAYAEQKSIETKKKIAQSKNQNKNMFEDAFEIATKLKELNFENRQFFIKMTRDDMNMKLKEVYASLARKTDREPELTENFELIIQNKESKLPQIQSTGERQITSLAFIGALVSYSREKAKSNLLTDFAGGDFPIVMDSPFGNLDGLHKEHTAVGLPALASQIVVIISDEQWKGTVSDNMYSKVNVIYDMYDGVHEGKDDEYTEIRRA